MIKLVALDLDDTLLNSEREISSKTIDKIKELQKKGIIIVLATGRPLVGIKQIITKYQLEKCPLITYNGGEGYEYYQGRQLFTSRLEEEAKQKIVSLGRLFQTNILLWCDDVAYLEGDLEYTMTNYHHPITKVDDILKIKTDLPQKIIWIDEAHLIAKYQEQTKKEQINANFFTSKPYYLEFVPFGVSKGLALEMLCNTLNIKLDNVLTIGDGDNDITMIKKAKIGIAMGNASVSLKEVADDITESNDFDGVYYALCKYLG